MASPWPSQRNSSAPPKSRCSAAATSSSKSSREGTAVTVIAISMTSLNPVINLRQSSQESGGASNLRSNSAKRDSADNMQHGAIAALIASRGEPQTVPAGNKNPGAAVHLGGLNVLVSIQPLQNRHRLPLARSVCGESLSKALQSSVADVTAARDLSKRLPGKSGDCSLVASD